MLDKEEYKINTYFLNKKFFHSIIDKESEFNLIKEFPQNVILDVHQHAIYEDAAINYIKRSKVLPLNQLLLTDKLKPDILVTYLGAFFFKKNKTQDKRIFRRTFHIQIPEFGNIEIKGGFGEEHFTCNSAQVRLAGKSRVFLFGYIEKIENKSITIKPIIFADRVLVENNKDDLFSNNKGSRVHPEDIKEFGKITEIEYPAIKYHRQILDIIKNIPEDEIKKKLGHIMLEGDLPNDWGGEKSDVYTNHLTLNSKRIRSAFILKGPSKFKRLEPKDLGKNGDQIIRLFDEIADLYVLQHCHYVSPSIEKLMDAFASRYMNTSRYMIIDGIDTYRILKAYKMI